MRLTKYKGELIFLICISLGLSGCYMPLRAEESIPAEEIAETAQIKSPSLEEQQAGTVGVARFYKKRYDGRRTSSGAIHNSKKLTAAHPTLPLGTRVKVINLANNRSVIVTVNDRCREHEESFIDLSRQAARQLGFIRQGKANVRIIPIDEDNLPVSESSTP